VSQDINNNLIGYDQCEMQDMAGETCWTIQEELGGTCLDGPVELTQCGDDCLGYSWNSMSSAVLQRVAEDAPVPVVDEDALLGTQCTLTSYGSRVLGFKATDYFCWGNCFTCDGATTSTRRPICIESNPGSLGNALCDCGCSGGSYASCISTCPPAPEESLSACVEDCTASC
jgi:hypothetical protein